jgi:dipeptidase E
MKLLLTSNGLSNASIADTLEQLVGKPRKEIKIAHIPTAAFPEDDSKHETKGWLVDDLYRIKEFAGFVDIVSLADLSPDEVVKRLEYADVIFVGGGNAFYLSYWMERSGLFDKLPELLQTRVIRRN